LAANGCGDVKLARIGARQLGSRVINLIKRQRRQRRFNAL
jgi:hypothetical protein